MDSAAGDAGPRPSADGPLDPLVDRWLPKLHAYVRLNMGPQLRAREESVDLVQSVCRELLEQGHQLQFHSESAFQAWLFRTALNKVRQHGRSLRAQKRDVLREGDWDAASREACASLLTPSEDAMRREDLERLERAVDALPDDWREVVTLARLAGLSSREIGEQTGRKPAAVRMMLGRALRHLGAAMREGEADAGPGVSTSPK